MQHDNFIAAFIGHIQLQLPLIVQLMLVAILILIVRVQYMLQLLFIEVGLYGHAT